MKRRQYLFGSAMALGGAAVIGSGSFSKVEAQREAQIEVVGDGDAYLYLEYSNIEFGCEADGILVVTVGNQLKDDITDIQFDLQIEGNGISVERVSTPDTIPLGEKVEITADLKCQDNQGTATASFDIDVSGNGASVDAHRSEKFEIKCECLFDLTGISFIAFCREDDTAVSVEHLEETGRNAAGETVRVDWETDEAVDEVILQGGREWYLYSMNGASSGSAMMDKPPADQFADAAEFDIEGGNNQVQFDDGITRSPASPCGDGTGTKVEF